MTDDQAVTRIENAKNGVEAVVRVARALKEIRGEPRRSTGVEKATRVH